MTRTKLGGAKMIQIKGLVKFPITLDSTTWIFDDRKVKIEDIESGVFEGTKPLNLKIIVNGTEPFLKDKRIRQL